MTPTLEPQVLAELQRLEALAATRTDARAVPPATGAFLHALVLASDCRYGLELGTSYGYSGLWLGAAFKHTQGQLISVDRDIRKVAAARETFAHTGLGETVQVHAGIISEVIAGLAGPFDFVFIDADKPNSLRYLELLWAKLAQRAVIVTDNVTSHATELAEFVRYLRGHSQLYSTLVPVGSGLELTIKLDLAPPLALGGADWII